MHVLTRELVFACAGLILVLIVRRPVRRIVGPGPTFTLWALPLVLAAAACLPHFATGRATGGAGGLLVIPRIMVSPGTHAAAPAMPSVWLVLWLAGCALMVLRMLWHYRRLRRAMQPLDIDLAHAVAAALPAPVLARARAHQQGPAVLWGWPKARLLLPADFLQRFDARARRQVLAHEGMHLARRDPLWSLLAELMLAALWFFPPAWFALSRFRLDQELACDAAVLRHARPAQAACYARTLLEHRHAPAMVPVLNTWFSAPQLKERLKMIQHPHSLLRRPAGYAALVVLLIGGALAAHAAVPASGTTSAPAAAASTTVTVDADRPLAFENQTPPHYPPEAIKKHMQGTTVLRVLVGTDGKPLKTALVRSSGHEVLDQAAANAAMKWQFKLRVVDGKPVRTWAKIPVTFRLSNPAAASSSAHVVPGSKTSRPPIYPVDAIKHREQGTVVLKILVGIDGKPETVQVDQSSGSASLDQAAVKAAKQWQFQPGMKDGKPYSGWTRVPVSFRLRRTDVSASSASAAPTPPPPPPALMIMLQTPPAVTSSTH